MDKWFDDKYNKYTRKVKTDIDILDKQDIAKSKNFFKRKYRKLIVWLNWRNHRKYNYKRRQYYLTNIFVGFVISLAAFIIFYSNIGKLNEIRLWIIKLGSVLLLTSLYFVVKYGWRTLKEIHNWFKRERNWIRFIIIIGILFLVWYSYVNKNTVLNPVFDTYNQTNFSYFFPLSLDSGNSDSNDKSFIQSIKEIVSTKPERKEECILAFDYVNELRTTKGKKTISWDNRAYSLAVARARDMYERNYFDHVTPEGTCVDTMKKDYGFNNNEWVAENVGAVYSGYTDYDMSFATSINVKEQVDGWMDSRGHRYNLMYLNHKDGAIGCYYGVCVFLGVNNDLFGIGCHTGDEGLGFWNSASGQMGEN